METRAHHVVVGAFALIVLLLGMAFALWLGKSALDREWREVVIVFEEAVTGLGVGGAVQYNGIQVGEVRRLALDPNDPSRVLATVRLGADVPVKVDTRAKLTFTGLTGVALIQLSGGSRDAPALRSDGDTPPRIVADTSALQQLLSSSEDIALTTREVLVRINRLLDEDNATRVARTLENLETLSGAAAAGGDDLRTVLAESAEASRRLATLLDGADGVMRRLDDGLSRADAALSRELPGLLERLQASLDALEKVSANSAALIADNRAALDDFSQQGLAQVGPALQDLRKLLVEWQRLSERLGESPAEFVRGREALPEYQP